jgi:hypothetical protein
MVHTLQISDDNYQRMETLAAGRGQTPEELVRSLLDEAWERECAKYDAAFHTDPGWLETAREAEAGTEGQATSYPSTEAFFQHLGASEGLLRAARQLDCASDEER